MTVHGAKGLEAPVVIMADTTTSPSDTQRLRLIHLPQGNGGKARGLGRTQGGRSAWRRRRAQRHAGGDRGRISPPALCRDDARGRSADHRRLHARQQEQRPREFLVRSDRARPWQIRTLRLQEIPAGDGVVKSYRRAEDAAPETDIAADAAAAARSALPEWLRTAAPAGAGHRPPAASVRSRHRRRPSASDQANRSSCGRARCCAARWCTGCCNRCPTLPPRAAAMRRCGISPAMPATGPRPSATALAEAMLALIADPRFAPVFAPGSRAEVSIAGRLERPGRPPALVSGQIDRLVVTADRGPDRRLQDQSCPAGDAGRGAARAMSGSLRSTGRCCRSFIPNCRSAPRCFGPKPLN